MLPSDDRHGHIELDEERCAVLAIVEGADAVDVVIDVDVARDGPTMGDDLGVGVRREQMSPIQVPRCVYSLLAQDSHGLVSEGRLGPDSRLCSDEHHGAYLSRSEIRDLQCARSADGVPDYDEVVRSRHVERNGCPGSQGVADGVERRRHDAISEIPKRRRPDGAVERQRVKQKEIQTRIMTAAAERAVMRFLGHEPAASGVGLGVWLVVLVLLVGFAGCVPASGATPRSTTYLQANLAGGWADGAERKGVDDVVVALVGAARATGADAVFLNEACESHAIAAAVALGGEWDVVFVQAWDGHSDCFPARGSSVGRFGNAVLVESARVTAVTVPSCNDAGASPERCVPNWAPPAEQRRVACAAIDSMLLCSAHLDPRHWAPHDAQLRALGQIFTALVEEYEIVVVGGDLNDGAAAARRAFGADAVDLAGQERHLTYPAAQPRRDLDHILAGGDGVLAGGMRTVDLGFCDNTHVAGGRCTDHLAVVADLVAG